MEADCSAAARRQLGTGKRHAALETAAQPAVPFKGDTDRSEWRRK